MRTLHVIFAGIVALSGCSSYSATIVKADPDAGTQGNGGTASSSASTGGAAASGGTVSIGATGDDGSTAGGTGSIPSSLSNAEGGIAATGGTAAIASAPLGGAAATGGVGGVAATGGVAAIGGVNSTLGGASAIVGGAAPTGGAAVSTGGASITAGGTSTIANSALASTGGAPASTGGAPASTGGASACSKDADCTNADPINCSYTCENPGASGTCKPAALVGPTQCIAADCPVKPISGFWDADGKPHIAYGWTESDGSGSIRMQQVKLDGTQEGAAVAYKLPAGQKEPSLLSSSAKGNKVGLLWESSIRIETTQAPISEVVVDFAATDVAGTQSVPTEVVNYGNNSPVSSSRLWLQVPSAGIWLALGILHPNAPPLWQATSGSAIGGWSTLSPTVRSGEFASGVIGDTLMLTGSDCSSTDSGCQVSFKLQRYSVSGLTSIGTFISLSQNFQSNEWPAMGTVKGGMALLWTETQSPGQMFRTLLKEDGTFALAIGTIQSAIQPKAIIGAADGGALLIGSIVAGNPIMYQLVGQRLDSKLGLIGNPLPVADGETEDATGLETRLSADGSQVLITYTQVGAKYRVISTNFCR